MSNADERGGHQAWAQAWHWFCELDDMFPTRLLAVLYLVGLGGFWTGAGVAMLTDSPTTVIVPMVACYALFFIPILRLLWIRRWPPTRFLVAYLAMINLPCQVFCATRRAGWKLVPTWVVLGSLLAADLVIMFTVVAPRSV